MRQIKIASEIIIFLNDYICKWELVLKEFSIITLLSN